MAFPTIAHWLHRRLVNRIASQRMPDYTIGPAGNDQMRRWWVIPRNPVLNIYLHQFLRSDDDRALHDHPWWNVSFLLMGCYVEHTIAAGGVHHRKFYYIGDLKFRGARSAHRIELLPPGPDKIEDVGQRIHCWSLFITGPKVRDWGFHCPVQGWIPWQRFTKPGNKGEIGPGCDG